jgi:hypothetical protein
MKKLIILGLLGATLSVNAGGLWDMVKNTSSDGNLKTKQYTIEVSGTNTRGYVFEVPEMNSVCFLTYSSQGIPAMDCKTYTEIKGK